jgi:hypothetical protein
VSALYDLNLSIPDRQSDTISVPNVGLDANNLPATPAGPVTASIGIRHTFTLSPGDVVAFTSYFEVVPVPEPASVTAVAAAVGAGSLARRGRRRG